MTPTRFLETNVLVRHIAGDNPVQSPQSTALMRRISEGHIVGLVSMTLLFETVYVLNSVYRLERDTITGAILAIIGTPGIRLIDCHEDIFDATMSLFSSISRLSFADCYHAALSLALCDGEIYTYDREFDRVPDLTRLEPEG